MLEALGRSELCRSLKDYERFSTPESLTIYCSATNRMKFGLCCSSRGVFVPCFYPDVSYSFRIMIWNDFLQHKAGRYYEML